MLRRRRKTPKAPIVVVPELPGRARRRPRPGVAVPNELILTERVSPPRAVAERARQPAKRGEAVLVTGFDAFCGEKVNPSWQVCERLPKSIAGLRVETCRIPCEFGRAIEVATAAIDRCRPVLVICLGQAGGRAHLSVERVAINVDDARIADNDGARPIDEPIAADGPPAYFSTLPIKAMVQAMHAAGIPAQVSNSAGTYVCNHLMYGVLHYVSQTAEQPARAGFIHVPYSDAQVIDKPGIAAMGIDAMVKGITAAIEAAARTAADIKLAGGSLD